jgi:hypothetical protein
VLVVFFLLMLGLSHSSLVAYYAFEGTAVWSCSYSLNANGSTTNRPVRHLWLL